MVSLPPEVDLGVVVSILMPTVLTSFSGRPWSIQELREKSWDDLHALWWVCAKERNRIATSNLERERLKAGYGEYEASDRDRVVSVLSPFNDIRFPLRQKFHTATQMHSFILVSSRGVGIGVDSCPVVNAWFSRDLRD